MEILQYSDLAPARLRAAFDRTVDALRAGDFRAADVKKLRGTPFYRAKLSDADRLLFRFGVCRGKTYLLLLEIIYNHEYAKSRFLGGAPVDEEKLEPIATPDTVQGTDIAPLVYVNPRRHHFHVLDRILSFDDLQAEAFMLRPPVILIGCAGSGKTVLTLEKVKTLRGDVLYVTLSAYLADNARNLYYSHNYENEQQNVDFLSFREFLETIRVPAGKPVTFSAFRAWFARHGHASRIRDPHMVYEEFNGVLTGMPVDRPFLGRDDYLALGVRRSIFLQEHRPAVHDLFLKYLEWLRQAGLYSTNLVAHDYLDRCGRRYDFAVVDEVQDITNVQLSLILRSLRFSDNFVLCGDANQIVHPNFFSWTNVKTLFYEQRESGRAEIIRVLDANYRNSPQVIAVANRLLLIKNARFGSIDRESNYLVRCTSETAGRVEILDEDEKLLRELNARTSRSTRFAVMVMRDEDKSAAAGYFKTPLIFSVQEAKGLEYESVILYNLVSGNPGEFNDIIEGVTADALSAELRYARAKDKTDKSLEAYKFYINALYVALTRAVQNIFIVERQSHHRLWSLLGLSVARAAPVVRESVSTAEEWKEEARKLELQGKTEQAEAIRRTVLGIQPVPWRILTPESLKELEAEALDPQRYNRQAKQLLFEYALIHGVSTVFRRLVEHDFKRARTPLMELPAVREKYYRDYRERGFGELKRKINLYGVDFRNPLNQTPLMIAAELGMSELARTLIGMGARREAVDNWGRTPLRTALRRAYSSSEYAAASLGAVYPLLAPPSIKVRVEGRLIKIDQRLMEYFLLESMISGFQELLRVKISYDIPAFETRDFIFSLAHFPEHVLPERRKRRQYLSSILAKNEIDRDDPYNRMLFLRVRHGHYIVNPALEIETDGDWVNVYDLIHISQLEQESGSLSLRNALRYIRTWQERLGVSSAPDPHASG